MTEQKEIHEFKFRAQLETIDYLNIDGDIALSGVHWGGRYFQIPFTTSFPDGHIRAGDRILVYATPKGNFAINLLGKNGDVLFHLNPRFSEKSVIRNAQLNGEWGTEEREGAFPFKKEVGTDIVISIEPYSIQIFVDNKRYGTFAHRTANPDEDYVGVRVDGEIDLTGLEFTHPQNSQHPHPRN
uniref:Galectin n=1 Tax=Panagrolaimus superbus TaxID=310955 RepID=A0A914Y4V6_9BILA